MSHTVRWQVMLLATLLTACHKQDANSHYAGYVEAVHFYVSAPQAGWIVEQPVQEGSLVQVGALVARLDDDAQRLSVEQAAASLAVAEQQLEDLRQGARPLELAVVQKQLDEQQAILREASLELERQQSLLAKGLTSAANRDKALAQQQAASARVGQLQRQLEVLLLPAREHNIEAASMQREVAVKSLALANWQLEQRQVQARHAGVVDEVYFREGEFVSPGAPIVSLIQPASRKVRFYVPQAHLSRMMVGQELSVHNDSGQQFVARVTVIDQAPQFTPPILFNQQSRQKLVFMVEAAIVEGDVLRPGQPVDVRL